MSAADVYTELSRRYADDRTPAEYERDLGPAFLYDGAVGTGPEYDEGAPELPVERPPTRVRDLDTNLDLETARFHLYFPSEPRISGLADALTLLDRETRRVATALETEIDPRLLRGRGIHLRRRADGLQVAEARSGSLDLVVLLGGLVSVVTSQPVSFALNLSTLVGYGRAVIGLRSPETDERSQRIHVEGGGTTVDAPGDGMVLFDAEDKDGARLRFAYFPAGDVPDELPERFFED